MNHATDKHHLAFSATFVVQPANFKNKFKASAFTIIELLVVITIIALLISLLIPSLEKARFLSLQTICAGRLHQMDIGLLAYIADAKDVLPYEPTAAVWNEERFMQRVDPAGGLPNPGPINLGRLYLTGYAREPKLWGCPATDYTIAEDHRYKGWDAAPLNSFVSNTPTYVNDNGLGTSTVSHGWFYYGPITTGCYVAGTGDLTPYIRMGQRKASWPALSDIYFRTDDFYTVDVIAHRQQNINVCRNDGAVWKHTNPLQVNPVTSWSDVVDYSSPGIHPWDAAIYTTRQATAAVGP